MQYEITEAGIRYIIEPEPIPDAEAVETIKRIAAKQRADLEACECVQQGAPTKCGMCEST